MSNAVLQSLPERGALLAFVFHSLFTDEREVRRGVVDPYQPFLVRELRILIEYFLARGYRFVTPAQILSGLDPRGRYALITFDDGYANNLRALPVLREFEVPATFFVSANHVSEGRAFWWDTVYRERRKRGVAEVHIRREQAALKRRPYAAVDTYVRAEFGARAYLPVGDTDRPMTPTELIQMASEPLVTFGNHTADHAALTVHEDRDVRAQIGACQEYLARLAGAAPHIIAYPYGNYDRRAIRIAHETGLLLGVGTAPRKNRLPLGTEARMILGRYAVNGGPALLDQCQQCRSDLQISNLLRRWRNCARSLLPR